VSQYFAEVLYAKLGKVRRTEISHVAALIAQYKISAEYFSQQNWGNCMPSMKLGSLPSSRGLTRGTALLHGATFHRVYNQQNWANSLPSLELNNYPSSNVSTRGTALLHSATFRRVYVERNWHTSIDYLPSPHIYRVLCQSKLGEGLPFAEFHNRQNMSVE
jgi:hypothetical protein